MKNKKHPCDKGAKTHGTTLVFHSLALTRRVRRGSSPAARERNPPWVSPGASQPRTPVSWSDPFRLLFSVMAFLYRVLPLLCIIISKRPPFVKRFFARCRESTKRGKRPRGERAPKDRKSVKSGDVWQNKKNRAEPKNTVPRGGFMWFSPVLLQKCREVFSRRSLTGAVRRLTSVAGIGRRARRRLRPRQRMATWRRKARDFRILSTNLSTASGASGSSPVGRKVRPNAMDFLPAPICSER